MKIVLTPVEMTPDIMQMLESKKLIIRMTPNRYKDSCCIYKTEEKYGSHMLISCKSNITEPLYFGTHPGPEEFILLGDNNAKPLYLVIATCTIDEFNQKVNAQTLSSADFLTLKVKFNDPEVSFFTMLPAAPHGEFIAKGEGEVSSFYVTESSDLGLCKTDMGLYSFDTSKC